MNRSFKRITKLSVLAIISLTFIFCSKESAIENDETQNHKGDISLPDITANFSPMTKAGSDTKITTTHDGKVSWDTNDRLTTYIVEAGYKENDRGAWGKAKFQYMTDATACKDGKFKPDMAEKIPVLESGKNYDWYVMSPIGKELGNPLGEGNCGFFWFKNFTVDVDNRTSHLTNYDIMTGIKLNHPAEAAPDFQLEHKGTLMKFTFINEDKSSMTLNEITFQAPGNVSIAGKFIVDFKPGAALRPNTGAWDAKSDVKFTFTKDGEKTGLTLKTGEKFDAYMIMPPFTLPSGSSFTVKASTSIGTLIQTSTPQTDIEFKAGTINTANIKLKATHIESFSIEPSSLQMKKGDKQKIVPIFQPANPDNKSVYWRSSNNRIARVDEEGNITAMASGTAIITATTADGGKKATCTVNVIALNQSHVVLNQGGSKKLELLGLNADVSSIIWTSNDPSIATVSPTGELKAITEGFTQVTGTIENSSSPSSSQERTSGSLTFTAEINVLPSDFKPQYVEYKGIPIYLVQVKGNPEGTVKQDFHIGQFEVSQELWYAVMSENGSHHQGNPLFPAEKMTDTEALEFIRRLNKELNLNFSLPTVAQWEYAAAGGLTSEDFIYSGSNSIGEVAWYKENSEKKTHVIGTKRPNGLGIFDMSGNVSEWCSDIKATNQRYIKGGSYQDPANYAVITNKENGSSTGNWGYNIFLGIRLVISDYSPKNAQN